MKKLMIAAFIAVLSTQAIAFDDTEYANNEEYCEEIYWEDEYNCVAPGQSVTVEFCESIVFPDTREVCFKALEDSTTD